MCSPVANAEANGALSATKAGIRAGQGLPPLDHPADDMSLEVSSTRTRSCAIAAGSSPRSTSNATAAASFGVPLEPLQPMMPYLTTASAVVALSAQE